MTSHSRLLMPLVSQVTLVVSGVAGGDLLVVEHESAALERRAAFSIFVPAGEPPAGGWPVLYLLHGVHGGHRDWWTRTDVERSAQDHGVLIVFPDGGELGWYLDSPTAPADRYETHVVEELVPLVERAFQTRRDRGGRGICGLSMGGHGAISLAAKHPELFGSASSLSGTVNLGSRLELFRERGLLGTFTDATDLWLANSCDVLAPRLVGVDVRLHFDCGDSDATASTSDNRRFHDQLTDLGVHHTFTEHPGGHSWEYWGDHIGEHILFHAECFSKSQE